MKLSPRHSNMSVSLLGTFGEFSRYALERWTSTRPVLVAIGAQTTYVVLDAETVDPVTGGPTVVRQEATREAALAGLASARDVARLAA